MAEEKDNVERYPDNAYPLHISPIQKSELHGMESDKRASFRIAE